MKGGGRRDPPVIAFVLGEKAIFDWPKEPRAMRWAPSSTSFDVIQMVICVRRRPKHTHTPVTWLDFKIFPLSQREEMLILMI